MMAELHAPMHACAHLAGPGPVRVCRAHSQWQQTQTQACACPCLARCGSAPLACRATRQQAGVAGGVVLQRALRAPVAGLPSGHAAAGEARRAGQGQEASPHRRIKEGRGGEGRTIRTVVRYEREPASGRAIADTQAGRGGGGAIEQPAVGARALWCDAYTTRPGVAQAVSMRYAVWSSLHPRMPACLHARVCPCMHAEHAAV